MRRRSGLVPTLQIRWGAKLNRIDRLYTGRRNPPLTPPSRSTPPSDPPARAAIDQPNAADLPVTSASNAVDGAHIGAANGCRRRGSRQGVGLVAPCCKEPPGTIW